MAKKVGIDISRWQFNINWALVAKKISFVYVKVGDGNEGSTLRLDHVATARAVGLPVGGYWFCRNNGVDPEEQARRFLDVLASTDALDLPVAPDIERLGGFVDRDPWAAEFGQRFSQVLIDARMRVMPYSNEDFMKNTLKPETWKLQGGKLVGNWVANYSRKPTIPHIVWQQTDKGDIEGIPQNVDVNVTDANLTQEGVMPNSQNGWSANNRSIIHNPVVPGTDGITLPGGVRKGSAGTILLYVARRFHQEVEPLTKGWNWGYAEREVRGGTDLSNHASGTAIDLNAPNHPLGKSGTFSAAKVAKIRSILSACQGTVRWGGDYSGRKDEMHFEIDASESKCNQVAATLGGGGSSTPGQEDDMFEGKHENQLDAIYNLLLWGKVSGATAAAAEPIGLVDRLAAIQKATAPLSVEVGPRGEDGKAPTQVRALNDMVANLYGQTFFGSNWGSGPSILSQLAKAADDQDTDLDPDTIRAAVQEAVTAANDAFLVQVRAEVLDAVGEDNEELAEDIVRRIGQNILGGGQPEQTPAPETPEENA